MQVLPFLLSLAIPVAHLEPTDDLQKVVARHFARLPARGKISFEAIKSSLSNTAGSADGGEDAGDRMRKCFLLQLIDGKAYIDDSFQQVKRHTHCSFLVGRMREVATLFENIAAGQKVPNVDLPVCTGDYTPLVSANLTVPLIAPVTATSNPTTVPFPMAARSLGTETHEDEGSTNNWPKHYSGLAGLDPGTNRKWSWDQRRGVAYFRGALRQNCGATNGDDARWKSCGRGALFAKAQEQPELFDALPSEIAVDLPGIPLSVDPQPASKADEFKYALSIGGHFGWSDGFKQMLFRPSVTLKVLGESEEWFQPLLAGGKQLMFVDPQLANLTASVQWLREHDDVALQMTAEANTFAHQYLSPDAMAVYAGLVAKQYAAQISYSPQRSADSVPVVEYFAGASLECTGRRINIVQSGLSQLTLPSFNRTSLLGGTDKQFAMPADASAAAHPGHAHNGSVAPLGVPGSAGPDSDKHLLTVALPDQAPTLNSAVATTVPVVAADDGSNSLSAGLASDASQLAEVVGAPPQQGTPVLHSASKATADWSLIFQGPMKN